jgi:hypothetical protein
MGVAVPGNYYLGGNTAFSGGAANYYPRGNLSTLTWQPMANLNAPKRDYDQHWETGGPNGWRCKVQEKQQEAKGPGQSGGGQGGGSGSSGGGSTPAAARTNQMVMARNFPVQFATGSSNGSSSSSSGGQQQQQQQQQDYTEFSFDKNGQIISQSKDRKHYLKVSQKDKKVMLTGEGDSTLFGKNNAYLNSASLCIVNPGAQSEESGAGWDGQKEGGTGQSGGGGLGGGGLGGLGSLNIATLTNSEIQTRHRQRLTGIVTPFDSGGGGGGGGGGGKVYLGGDPKKDKFCLVQTVCGPSKNVYAKI